MTSQRIIKVCGMKEGGNIRAVEAIAAVDMIGMVFYPPSPRYVARRPDYLPARAARVGVFVDEDARTVLARAGEYRLDYVQLHGHESPEYCRALQRQGVSPIKAFSIGCAADLERTAPYEGLCRYFLFDTACKGYGGSGNAFDWRVLRRYAGSVPFLLSGGIGLHNAEALKQVEHPLLAGYDLNSRFELSPGRKDTEKIQQFVELLICNTDE